MKLYAGLLILTIGLYCGNAPSPPAAQPGSQTETKDKAKEKAKEEKLPKWLNELIERLKSEPVANPPAKILSYKYRDQTVYYHPPACCDQPSQLYDSEGKVICSPDGGFTGRGDGKCADFFDKRTDEKLIWADSRKK